MIKKLISISVLTLALSSCTWDVTPVVQTDTPQQADIPVVEERISEEDTTMKEFEDILLELLESEE